VYRSTQKELNDLRRRGYKVVEIWGFQRQCMKQENKKNCGSAQHRGTYEPNQRRSERLARTCRRGSRKVTAIYRRLLCQRKDTTRASEDPETSWFTYPGHNDIDSMWGKFGQKANKTQVKEFTDPVAFSQFHESDKNDICYVSVLNEQPVEINYKHQFEDDTIWPNLNVFLGCFTTSWADYASMKPWTSFRSGR